ncbi:MAG TPA: hypothetical protein VM870_04400 [Pyrinomonadaceae bacterium]|jgi:type 1 fimbria pilin|nr:hypothetical protein [Pyrinomonadaceae bacterium]
MKAKFASLALLLAVVAMAAVSLRAEDQKVTLKGYLMDKACSTKAMKSPDATAAAKGHKKGCAQMEGCAASGYGIVSEGKFHAFDKNGNELAAKWLKETEKADNLGIEVVGMQADDGTVKVESLTEMK